jgi:nucleoside-diphosphate-sugar epimerase
MLEHTRDTSWRPARVVILGAGGFVGSALTERLKPEKAAVCALGRSTIDLLDPASSERLASLLQPEDALVVISARAPCKTPAMLEENVKMMRSVCEALSKRPVDHILYVSSDAVYADSSRPLTEISCAEPGSLHGAMHLAREIMLRSVAGTSPCAIVRPTLIYGTRDPHNGYGPNQFRRKARRGEEIVLFGCGEELRDHVLIDDVAEICARTLFRRSTGILNVATGSVVSFYDIAMQIAAMFSPAPAVRTTQRNGPMPHNGFRAFDTAACREAFPDFHVTLLEEGLRRVEREALGTH